ncbi:MAG: alpha/beta fold hydrolase [Flavobacteriales bacterium]
MTRLLPYSEVGTGIPLVLIHGFPHDRRLWEPQLNGLRNSARLIVPDLRGFGAATDVPATMGMEEHAADVKTLLEHLRITGAVICGLSMGGYVALAFAARFPGALRGLILCSTKAGADSNEAKSAREATALAVLDKGVARLADDMLPKMLAPTTLAARPELGASIRSMMAEQRVDGVVAALRGMAARPDRTGMLAGIHVSTLIIAGERDTLIPSTESGTMSKSVPRAHLVIVPDAAHLPNAEAPEVFNEAAKGFLGRALK